MNGVINVNKESGCSSFSVVNSIKKILNIKKCGHTGTLDPIAEGVLPICINQATKLSDYLMAEDKEYIASIKLGIKTDTMDITGKVICKSDLIPDIDNITCVAKEIIGKNSYKVPAFSAVKISGQRAYKLARKGLIEDAGYREMTVYSFDIIEYEYPNLLVKIFCEKGTYVRSLVDFLGEKLGCYGVMENLIRTRNGVFDIRKSYKLSEIEEMKAAGDFSFIEPLNKIIKWPICILKDENIDKFLNGVQIPKHGYSNLPIEEESDLFWVCDRNKKILGFAKKNTGKHIPLKVIKIFK